MNNLILRTTNSPYNDINKGSVLSQSELDNNFIYLKGQIIYTATTNSNILTLSKINGDIININISSSGSSGSDIYTTGATLIGGTIYFDRTDQLSAYTVNLSAFSQSSGSTYTNNKPTPNTLGGISAGTTFNNKTLQEMFDLLLYPYQTPAFTSFSLGISSPKEIGFDITTAQTFTWSTSNGGNVSANTLSISGYNLLTLNNLANDSSENVIFTNIVTRNSSDGPGTRAWTIQGLDTNGNTFNASLSIRWDWTMYAGTSVNTSLTESQIEALIDYKSVKNGFSGTFNMSAGGYKYFCFATVYGTPNSFIDASNNLSIGMYNGFPNIDGNGNSYDLVSVTNSQGETTNYRVYRTLNQLGGTINVIIN